MSAARLEITVASRFAARSRGLLGRSGLDPDRGLLIVPCSSIHTLFMRFAIDAVFFDAAGVVTRIAVNIGPWRIALGGRGTACLELAAHGAARHGFTVGDRYPVFARNAIAGRRTIDFMRDRPMRAAIGSPPRPRAALRRAG